MKADEAIIIIQTVKNLVQDSGEKLKLNNWILGAVESSESFEQKKARIIAQLDKKERYQIKPKKK